ncbi:N-glycosidase [Penicillium diatomitis]|uniref:N-glycosidase n=1 Tax=Penicillium diatomitis TaxID=2819901 RepID=A0A9W9X7G2_9EURO|nr:N-glycosidase [Penicillium diatomitis]KAJ5485080.1 N-glycosidase [Penicillium diatomitis]
MEHRRDSDNPVYFWKPEGEVGYLGQWWPSPFKWEYEGEMFTYANAEQYMMHRKALLFAGPSHPITHEIRTGWKLHPRDLQNLGRKIPNFDDEAWEQHRFGIVVEGNYLKFSQNEDLRQKLLATGDRELIEASPRDRVWGIGFGVRNAGENRSTWGLNLLGQALMEARCRIQLDNLQLLREPRWK